MNNPIEQRWNIKQKSKTMAYVYILLLANAKLYTGYTKNLKRRFQEHSTGNVKSTCHALTMKLIFYEAYILDSDARRREKFLKTTEGRRLLRQQLQGILQQVGIIA